MSKFQNLKLEDNILEGIYVYGDNKKIKTEFHLEDDDLKFEDFSELISEAEIFAVKINEDSLTNLKSKISVELTDSAYSDSNYSPTKEDCDTLQDELILRTIRFFPDSAVSFIFEAKNNYPDMLIYCQVDDELVIEDLIVN